MRNRSSRYLVPFFALVFLFGCVGRVYAVAGLRVKCNIAGAELFLNGKSMGTCPGKFTPDAGRYKLELRKDLADKSYYYYRTDITLPDGDPQTVDAQLERVYTDEYYYRVATQTGSVSDYREYLRRYPSGNHALEVQQVVTRLEREASERANREARERAEREARELQAREVRVAQLPTEIDAQMVNVKGGCFKMGSKEGEFDEKPVHKVCVSDFYIGKFEVTQGQWQAVMGRNPSKFSACGPGCPVEQVGWEDVQGFIGELNRLTGKVYRLPTEAEWEYAARSGGKEETYAGTSDESRVGEYAWYNENSDKKTHKVGTRNPNGLGLYDMSGNVCEWCSDRYGNDYYQNSPKDNPPGPASGSVRVNRGGSWLDDAGGLRAAHRGAPAGGFSYLGFRLARTP